MERAKKVYNEADLEKLKEAGASEEEIARARKLMPENVKRRKKEEEVSEIVAARSKDNDEETKRSKRNTIDAASNVENSATKAHIGNALQYRKMGAEEFSRAARSTARILQNYRNHRGHDYISKSNSSMINAVQHISVSSLENIEIPEITEPNDLNKTLSECLARTTAMQNILQKQKEILEATNQTHNEAVAARSEKRSNQMGQGVRNTLHGLGYVGAGMGNMLTGRPISAIANGAYGMYNVAAGIGGVMNATLGSVNDAVENFVEEKRIADQQTSINETTHAMEDVATQTAMVKEALARQQR